MTALSTRDALAKALDWGPLNCTCGAGSHDFCGRCIADHLIASGAVVDAATLADKMTAWADEIEPGRQWLDFPVTPDEIRAKRDQWFAAALAERGESA